jgi:predicted MFS family arabinose efflux permease
MISVYGISNTIDTPFIPVLCKDFTRINILYFGTFFEATCTVLYGFLQYINSYYALLIITFFLRILHGMATASLAVLAFSIACSITDEKDIKNVIAKLEIGICLGTSIRPLFASFFYHLGGYTLPFLVLGIILYLSVYITTIIKRENNLDANEEIEENPSFLKLLTNFDILTIITALIIGSAYFVFYYPRVTNH